MPKFLVYPPGYCPMVAAGPPSEDAKKAGLAWSSEATIRHRAMETQAVVITANKPPVGVWSQPIDEKLIPPYSESTAQVGEAGVGVWLGDNNTPEMGGSIGSMETLTQKQLDFAQMVVEKVEKMLKEAGMLRNDARLGIHVPG